jgi:hypothetical protein
LIAEPLYLTKYIERMGTGIHDMIERCREAGLPESEFHDQGERLHFPDRYAEDQEWAQSSAVSPGKAVRKWPFRASPAAVGRNIGCPRLENRL